MAPLRAHPRRLLQPRAISLKMTQRHMPLSNIICVMPTFIADAALDARCCCHNITTTMRYFLR